MRRIILALASFAAISTLSSQASATPSNLLTSYKLLNEQCRGGDPNKADTGIACDKREKISKALKGAGYCFGSRGQYGGEMWWRRCTETSLRY